MQILKFDALVDVPWKNGGGTTRNIAKGMRDDHIVWTISRADVAQDGPFSDFAGMTRVLTVISGGAMTLESGAVLLEAKLWEPVRFDGALKIRSRLKDGPLTDLNLMFDPLRCGGDVVTHQGPLDQQITRAGKGLFAFHILSGTPTLNGTACSTGDTVFVEQPSADLRLAKGDAVLEIRLTYPDQSDAIKLCIATL